MQSGHFALVVANLWTTSSNRPVPSNPKPAPDMENSCFNIPANNPPSPAPRKRILNRTKTAAIRKDQMMREYLGRCTIL